MDIQLTDFENTCLIVLLGLLVNVINHYDVDFIIPVTKSDENMQRAHYRDAILEQKFWVNVNCLRGASEPRKNVIYDTDFKISSKDAQTDSPGNF